MTIWDSPAGDCDRPANSIVPAPELIGLEGVGAKAGEREREHDEHVEEGHDLDVPARAQGSAARKREVWGCGGTPLVYSAAGAKLSVARGEESCAQDRGDDKMDGGEEAEGVDQEGEVVDKMRETQEASDGLGNRPEGLICGEGDHGERERALAIGDVHRVLIWGEVASIQGRRPERDEGVSLAATLHAANRSRAECATDTNVPRVV